LAGVTRAWEAAAWPAAAATRLTLARTGLVLAKRGPTGLMVSATRVGLGCVLGTGSQHWPWISLRDEARAWVFALGSENVSGPCNFVGPNPATASEVAHTLAEHYRRPCLMRAGPGVVSTLGGNAAKELVLASVPVRPKALLDAGFVFQDPSPRATWAALDVVA
jgi:NAD dependent epimerase/dehydratase family enzyme